MKKTAGSLIFQVLTILLFVYPVMALVGPTDQVKPTLEEVLVVLSDDALRGAGHKVERRTKVMEIIKKSFDFREMSRKVLGKMWEKITQSEQDHFVELMTKLLENIYIGKLESYSGQKIEYVGEKIRKNKALVSTTIDNKNQKIPIHYILVNMSSRWMVYDINIDGVSLVKNYRQQFKSVLKRDRFPGLVRELEQMNKDLAGGSGNS